MNRGQKQPLTTALLAAAAVGMAVFFFMYTAHLPLMFQLLLTLPVLFLNCLLGTLTWLAVQKRLRRPVISLWPELLAVFCLLALFAAFHLHQRFAYFFIMLLLALLWLVVQFLLKRIGNFYVAFIGILIFTVVLVSYRLLFVEEVILFRALSYISMLEEKRAETVMSADATNKKLLLRRPGTSALQLQLPEDLHYHRAGALPRKNRLFGIGTAICVISASPLEPLAEPYLVVRELADNRPQTPGDFRESFDMLLGHLRNKGDIEELQYEGHRTLEPPISGMLLRGVFWTYRDARTGQRTRTGLYLLRSLEGLQRALVIRDPVTPGLRHHPDVLYVLRRMKWIR